jgi:hypothetical protein
MSNNRKNPYLFYTEYYLISGAYQVINVVNEILTYSASYSDNMKEYLRNQVASKQVALNEFIRNEQDARVNANPDNDVDEDGFVVIKMRRPKPKNANPIHIISNTYNHSDITSLPVMSIPMHNETNETSLTQASRHKQCKSDINTKQEFRLLVEEVIKQVMRDIISDVITKLETTNKLRN